MVHRKGENEMKYIVLALIGAFMGGSIVYIIMLGQLIKEEEHHLVTLINKRKMFDELTDMRDKGQR